MNKYQTEQRKILISFFENNNHSSFSPQEIYSQMSQKDISMSAIYRNLNEMEKEGVINKVSEKNRAGALYQYVDPHNCVGIIHLKCQSCNETLHLNKVISKMIFELAKEENDFIINDLAAYLYGKCKKCSQNNIN